MGAIMDIKRRAARGVAVLAVALAAGHLVQTMGDTPAPKPVASAALEKKPVMVETVAAGPEQAPPSVQPVAETIPPLPAAPLAADAVPSVPAIAKPADQPAAVEAPATTDPAPNTGTAAAQPDQGNPATTDTLAETPASEPQAVKPEDVAAACDVTLDLMTEPNAMIGITLLAPCHPDQRVVLRQGGLAVTGQTTATGALFTALPAFETEAAVEVAFANGTTAESSISVPDLASLRRFGVQWQADDAFQVHAFEGGASYGTPGHVSAADPQRPPVGMQATGGFLTLLGDASTDNPLLAEVYTFPADPAAKPEVIVEAAVTDKTCGRELLAETLTSSGGSVFVTDLTLAMPECDAVGDYLVLKNLFLDLNMASLN